MVPAIKVTTRNRVADAAWQTVTTAAAGGYTALNVPVGSYDLMFAALALKALVRS